MKRFGKAASPTMTYGSSGVAIRDEGEGSGNESEPFSSALPKYS